MQPCTCKPSYLFCIVLSFCMKQRETWRCCNHACKTDRNSEQKSWICCAHLIWSAEYVSALHSGKTTWALFWPLSLIVSWMLPTTISELSYCILVTYCKFSYNIAHVSCVEQIPSYSSTSRALALGLVVDTWTRRISNGPRKRTSYHLICRSVCSRSMPDSPNICCSCSTPWPKCFPPNIAPYESKLQSKSLRTLGSQILIIHVTVKLWQTLKQIVSMWADTAIALKRNIIYHLSSFFRCINCLGQITLNASTNVFTIIQIFELPLTLWSEHAKNLIR